jgi:squalene-hopene/tetraprenyl-beta-curcumene cyclase
MVGDLDLPLVGPYKVGVFAGRPPKDADHRVRFSQFRVLPSSDVAGQTAPNPSAVKAEKPPVPTPAKRSIRSDIPLEVQARETAERAIPFIEQKGTAWIKDRKCLSCHYSGYMLWSLRDAGERGLAVGKDTLAESTNWAISQVKDYGLEGAAQLLISRDRSDRSDQTTKQIARLRDEIIKGQDKEGFWKPGGQLPAQKRPVSETTQVSTMLCVLGLDALDEPNDKVIASRDRALKWLKATPPNGKSPAVSSEWYAARLVIEKKFGDPTEVKRLRDTILAAQRADGGWGWLWADKSDAFGTGVSVYALSLAGVPNSHPAIQKAWVFLIETQTNDGSWIVSGTKNETKDAPHPFSSYWGSAWALLGLSHSLLAKNMKGNQIK